MGPTKAQLEAKIRARRARLDRRLESLETRMEAVKEVGKKVGVVTGTVVMALAVLGTIALVVRSVVKHRRQRPMTLFAQD